MEFEVKKPLDIPDGQHVGVIVKVSERTDPYHYVDIWVEVHGQAGVEMKYGCPANISEVSKLGRLLTTFGVTLNPGDKINPEKELVGLGCKFMSLKKKTKDGKEFSEIVEDSLQPVTVEQKSST